MSKATRKYAEINKGDQFGEWTVASGPLNIEGRRGYHYKCHCSCGTRSVIWGTQLRIGRSTSCGCNLTKHGHCSGGEQSAEYQTWASMKRRASVCRRWGTFENFFADMGERPERAQLRRKNTARGFMPSNCYWG